MNCNKQIIIKDWFENKGELLLSCVNKKDHEEPHTSKIKLTTGEFINKDHPHWVSFNWTDDL